MKKLIMLLTTIKEKKGLKTARYATASDPISKTTACVDTEFFRAIHDFVASVEEFLHDDWERTRYEMMGLQGPDTPLKPNGDIFSGYHAAFLKSYEELKEQLCKKQMRVVINGPIGGSTIGKPLNLINTK